jgi:uncharacterized protein
LVFSLPIEEKWNKLRERGLTADWEILGNSAWNYGMTGPAHIGVTEHPFGDIPFGKSNRPVTLQLDGIAVANWGAVEGVAGDFPANPDITGAGAEKVTLVPYASAKLRITAFPVLDPKLIS